MNGSIIIRKNNPNKADYLNINDSVESLGTKGESGMGERKFFSSFMLSNRTSSVQDNKLRVKVLPKNRI